ncbi:MAG TPA: NAD(P)H-binding protein [Acidimicrobiales bacterium]|nr:NAD(P)H-binding protein [Acidimicrobiales bacterium]
MSIDVVTGAFGYTGRFITERLLAAGHGVRTLTGHPDRPNPFGNGLEVRPYRFDDIGAMAASMEGASTLFNTYWVRFPRGGTGFDEAVANSHALFEAARKAGVGRIVHVSITNPSADSPFGYFRGKALVEEALADTGVPYAIVRPTVIFGRGDVLVNNMAWLLRRFPVFPIAGDGAYQVRPVHVADVARLCVDAAAATGNVVVDAVGPETFTFAELVRAIAGAVGACARLVNVPVIAIPPLARGLGVVVRDVLLTPEELGGLMAGLVTTDGPATGHVALTEWLAAYGSTLGTRYASELQRHF